MKCNPDFLSNLCTSATSLETDAVGVPSGMRQKSAMHAGGVGMSTSNEEDVVGTFEETVTASDIISPEKDPESAMLDIELDDKGCF